MHITTKLDTHQREIAESPLDNKIFLHGVAGTGKTTTGIYRLLYLLDQGVSGSSILLLTPQRTLATPYLDVLYSPHISAGRLITYLTIGGLARRMADLFWPLIAEKVGFLKPDRPPIFLTLETAQYHMSRLVHPLLNKGYFNSLTINPNRLFSQIIDNLNKAAAIGIPHTEIGNKLISAWAGESAQARIYEDTQECANRFRNYCLENNLLDFSLQLEIFVNFLWTNDICREYLTDTYRYIIYDNLEEDIPVSHDIIHDWLSSVNSALLIYDDEAGYRRFLGADPDSALNLSSVCDQEKSFVKNYTTSYEINTLIVLLRRELKFNLTPKIPAISTSLELFEVVRFEPKKFLPEMLSWICEQISNLVFKEGILPGEIAVLSPFLSDALRFSITQLLSERNISTRSHRPSRSLNEESVVGCLITLSLLSHPQWLCEIDANFQLTHADLAYALFQAISDLDLVRAHLLSQIVLRFQNNQPFLSSFDRIKPDVQERISYRLGQRYEHLREWIDQYRQSPPEELDHFLSRIFGEVLSQPGFSFHNNYSFGEITANLIESIRKFRWSISKIKLSLNHPLGLEYIRMVREGVSAAQYLRSWEFQPTNSVLLAPAHTFLMANRPVDIQFWLEPGNRSWYERLYQPLTHPYILSRTWKPDRQWTDTDEVETSQESLYRLAIGLLHRCRKRLYLGLNDLNEQGYEQRGPLLLAFQRVFQDFSSST